jgi:uncharacterized protein with von Willebrand factor type A (vWA) domain
VSEVFTANLVHFVRHLRDQGLGVVPATAAELAAGIETIGLERRDDVYAALRAMTIARPTERPAFDEAFEVFFGQGRLVGPRDRSTLDVPVSVQEDAQLHASVPLLRSGAPEPEAAAAQITEVAGGSYAERLSTRDFRDLSPIEREEVRRIIARMMWRPADAPSRRWGPSRVGTRPDMRRTFRRVVRPEGDLLPLALADRRPRRRPLVVVADISGSMERYTEMFLYFIHAAQSRLGRIEAFVFATHLSRITRQMRQKLPEVAIHQVAAAVTDWSGGTRIGEALEAFNRDWSRRVTRGGAIGLIISDGWDTGDPELLEREMARFNRAMHRVVWLNPLAGRPGFAPETRGLRTALPHVDHFLAAATVLDLREVVRLLESVPTR